MKSKCSAVTSALGVTFRLSITVPVNHYDVITFHWKSSANPRWNYTGNGRILRGSAAMDCGGIKIFRGGIISGQVSGIAGGSEKSSAGVGGLVKIPLDCTVGDYTLFSLIMSHYYN